MTVMAFNQAGIQSNVVRVRDDVLALDYLLGRGSYAERNVCDVPAVIVLHLKLPGLGGLDVLTAIRDDDRIKNLPVVSLTSSNNDKARLTIYKQFATNYLRKRVKYDQFVVASQEIGLFWLVFNAPPLASAG